MPAGCVIHTHGEQGAPSAPGRGALAEESKRIPPLDRVWRQEARRHRSLKLDSSAIY